MKIQTTYTVGKVKHMSCWNDLEIQCENGDTVIVPMSTSDKKYLADNLLSRVKTDQQRELDNLKEAISPTEKIEE
jgi:hypothetical protein